MGKLVNVILDDGRVVAVPEEDAARLAGRGVHRESDQGAANRALDVANEERASGISQGAKTLVEGALDGASGGIYGKVAGALSPEYGEELANRGEHRSGLRAVGEVASVLAPTGLLGKGAKAATAFTAPAGAMKAGAAIGGKAGAFVEGALGGIGGYVAETNITGDPLTVEGALISGGVGGMLDLGFSTAGSKLQKAATKNQERIAQEAVTEADRDFVGSVAQKLDTDSWKGVKSAHKDAQSAEEKLHNEIVKETEQFGEFAQPAPLKKAIKTVEDTRAEIQARISATPYGEELDGMTRKLTAEQKRYADEVATVEKYVASTEKFPKHVRKIDAAIKKIARTHKVGQAVKQGEAVADDLTEQLAKTKEGVDAGKTLDEIAEEGDGTIDDLIDESEDLGDEVVSESVDGAPVQMTMADRIKEMRQLRSKATKLFRGGYNPSGSGWKKGNYPPNPEEALRTLHKLRERIGSIGEFQGKGHPSVSFPDDIPVVPRKPADVTFGEGATDRLAQAQELIDVSKQLSATISKSHDLLRQGDYSAVVAELRAAQGRLPKGYADLTFPELPAPPRALRDFPGRLSMPETVDDFARKGEDWVAKFAQQVPDGSTQHQAFERMMDDLGLEKTGLAKDDITATHRFLGDYRSKRDVLEAAAIKEGAEEGTGGLLGALGDILKRGGRGAARRGADSWLGGGAKGAFGSAFGGAAAGWAMGGVESALIGGVLASGKVNLAGRVRAMVAKYGTKTGTRIKQLGKVTSHLSGSFVGGQPDEEQDPSKQALNRITEIANARNAAPDALFLALEPLLGIGGDVAYKIHSQAMMALDFLNERMPKDQGLDVKMFDSNWSPSHEQLHAMAYTIEAVKDPLAAIERSIAGDGHPAATEALWTVFPALMGEWAQEVALNASSLGGVTYEQASNFSQLFRVPVSGLQEQVVVTALQGLYLPKPDEPGGSSGATGGAPGRPAAVKSKVAGASVGALTA